MPTVALSPSPVLSFNGNDAKPLVGGLLSTFVGGVNYPTYIDPAGSIQNTNPIVLNNRGEVSTITGQACGLFLEINVAYTFSLTDAQGNTIWSGLTVEQIQTVLTQDIIGQAFYPQNDAERTAGIVPSFYWYPYGDARRYGTVDVTGVTDSTVAVQSAINVMGVNGGFATVPAGTINVTSLLMMPNVTLCGAGCNATFLTSSSATGNGLTMTSTLNVTTGVRTMVRDLCLSNTNPLATGGGYVDVGGTIVGLYRVRVSGYSYGCIFDQTELGDIDQCEFVGYTTGGVWLCNGPDHTPGALPGFTNRISIKRCQFNSTHGACIYDDGGATHDIQDNNFNGSVNQIRIANAFNLVITNNEFEVATAAILVFANVTSVLGTAVGASGTVALEGNYFSPALLPSVQPTATIATGALTSLVVKNNRFITSTATITGCANVNEIFAYGNYDSGTGIIFDTQAAHHFETAVAKGFIVIKDDITLTGGLAGTQAVFGGLVNLGFGSAVGTDASAGNTFRLTATSNAIFTMNAPINPPASPYGEPITYVIRNTSGGALGTVTWNAVFKMASWTSPATGNSRSIAFTYDGTNWIETGRGTADIPN